MTRLARIANVALTNDSPCERNHLMTCKNCGEGLVWVELLTGGQGVRHESTGRMLCRNWHKATRVAEYDYPTEEYAR